MKFAHSILFAFVLLMTLTVPAWAYVGPGAGLSVLGALWALLLALLSAVGYIVLWPLRRARRRKRQAREAQAQQAAEHRDASGEEDEPVSSSGGHSR